MTFIEPTYDELRHRVEELGTALATLCDRQADTVTSKPDIGQLFSEWSGDSNLRPDQRPIELEAVIEAVSTALAVIGPGGEIRLANRAFLDASLNDSPGTLEQWATGVQANDQLVKQLKQTLNESFGGSGEPAPLESTFTTRSGNKVHWRLSFRRLPGPAEKEPAVVVTGIDVTDENWLVTQLSETKFQMEDFLGAVAHDLKSPLITIAHYATFTRMALGDDIPLAAAESLDRVESAGKEMLNLLSQLSEVSRAGRDLEPLKKHDFGVLVRSALSQLDGMLAARLAVVSVADDLPALYCQGTKFVQVFCNLISNAAKYTPPDRTPLIEVGHRLQSDAEHLFFVRDNGTGIPKEGLDKVFDMFARLADDLDIPGQGVGLTVVKRIVELHGGRVWVESVLGEGSTFFFTIRRKGA